MFQISRQRSFKISVKELLLGNVEDRRPGTSVKWAPSHAVLKAYTVDIRYLSNTRYLELSLYQTIYLVPSTFSLTSLINPFGLLNSDISNFHYVEQFSRSMQSFLGCFSSAISNIRMRFSSESYCSFQAFKC